MYEMDTTGSWQDESGNPPAAEDAGGMFSSAGSIASLATGNPLFAIGAQILGGIMGSSSAKKANKDAKKIAAAQMAFQERSQDKSMAFNSAQAAAQREWQTYMSSSSHQREIGDLYAAGLNPILSGTGGMGASTPSGASATSQAQSGASAPVINEGAAGLASALAVKNAQAQTDLLQAQTQKTYDEAALLRESRGGPTQEMNLKHSQEKLNDALRDLQDVIGKNYKAQTALTTLQIELADVNLEHFRERDLYKLNIEIRILEEELKTARRIGNLDASAFGEAMGYLKRFSDALPGINIRGGTTINRSGR